jgi:hypothetical protein
MIVRQGHTVLRFNTLTACSLSKSRSPTSVLILMVASPAAYRGMRPTLSGTTAVKPFCVCARRSRHKVAGNGAAPPFAAHLFPLLPRSLTGVLLSASGREGYGVDVAYWGRQSPKSHLRFFK